MRYYSKISLFVAAAIISATSLTSCKSKSKGENKRDLIAAIEHYDIEPVDTTGKAPLGSPDVNEILCHYPELYHATENVQKLYAKWAETEQNMVNVAFVGKSKARKAKAKKVQEKFTKHLEESSVSYMLDFVLLANDNPKPEEWTSNEPTSDLYLAIMSNIADGMAENAEHATTDDMRSAVGYARRAWKDYLDGLQKMIDAVPEGTRARYIKAVNDAVRHHYIDLLNRYYPYYENENPGWLLPYDATDDAIQNFTFDAFHDRDWVE